MLTNTTPTTDPTPNLIPTPTPNPSPTLTLVLPLPLPLPLTPTRPGRGALRATQRAVDGVQEQATAKLVPPQRKSPNAYPDPDANPNPYANRDLTNPYPNSNLN